MGRVGRGGEPGDNLPDALLHLSLMEHHQPALVGRERRRHGAVPGGIARLLEHPVDDVLLAPRPGLSDPR